MKNQKNTSKTTVSVALIWKLLERFGVQGIQFVLQIVLARILDPDHYGTLSMMIIFINLANIFIQTGFNTALVQNKDVTEEDYSSVFCVSTLVAMLLYIVIFVAAPFVGAFYEMSDIVMPLRVIALVLIPGALNSIQLAKASRELNFRVVFTSNIVAIIISGVVGIIIALNGGGLWALVAQTMLNTTIASVVMLFTVAWKPRLVCNFKRVKVLFSFGWKLLVSGLLDTLYQDVHSLIVGKKYDSSTLGFYNRGKQFPQFIVSAVNSSVQSVLLPVMSEKQDSTDYVKNITKRSVQLTSYIVFPIMAGLAGVASSLIELLLTEKWLPCVPYMQICCIIFAFYPVYSCNLYAINAIGRSDVFLKLEIIKKLFGIVLLAIAVFCFDTPLAIVWTGVISIPFDLFINSMPNRKLIRYSYLEQMKDILPPLVASAAMCFLVLCVDKLGLGCFPTLLIQLVVGVVAYLTISVLFQMQAYVFVVNIVKNQLRREKK